MRNVIVVAIVASALSVPAFAASTYYVVKDPKTKRCTVETSKPFDTTLLVMNTVPYKSAKEATTALKADPNCVQ